MVLTFQAEEKPKGAGGTSAGSEPGPAIPKARLASLSDLIFGLALSIGAFSLINSGGTSSTQILPNILAFGFSFLILMTVWIAYTRLTAMLPFESAGTVYPNVLMLFFVAVEPYLFNLLFNASNPARELTSVYYAVDLGSIFLCLTYLTQSLIGEEKQLISAEKAKELRVTRGITSPPRPSSWFRPCPSSGQLASLGSRFESTSG